MVVHSPWWWYTRRLEQNKVKNLSSKPRQIKAWYYITSFSCLYIHPFQSEHKKSVWVELRQRLNEWCLKCFTVFIVNEVQQYLGT